MRTYLTLSLGVLFVLGFAGSAFAIHADIPAETQAAVAKGATQITLGGELRFRGEMRNNTTDFNTDKGDSIGFYDSRVRLSVDAQVTPNIQGFVQVENNSDSAKSDILVWGGPSTTSFTPSSATGIYSLGGNRLAGGVNFLQAWILYKGTGLLGIPAGVKVGHMPLTLGNSIFFDHTSLGDDALVLFADPTKQLHVGLLNVKFREGSTALSDDADAYVGLFAFKTKEFGLSGDITYVDDQVGLGTSATAKAPINFWNFGLRGNTDISGLGLMADINVQAGKVKNTATATHGDVKFRGYSFMAGLSYKMDPVRLSLDFAYGSGDDNPNDGKEKAFVTSLNTTQHYTFVYDYRTVNACGQQYGGLCNTMYVKLGAGADLMKDLSADLSLYWLRAVKKFNGVPELGVGASVDSRNIGAEIDWNIKYKLDRNLNYWVEGGYLFAGAFFDKIAGKGSDNAYAIRHGIQLSF